MSSNKIPHIDESCGRHFVYRDFVECSDTWRSLRVDNIPVQLETFRALHRLAVTVLDPVVEQFGPITLTYGIANNGLVRKIKRGIAPRLDQHSSYERSTASKMICNRGGAACDFIVEDYDSLRVSQWLVKNTRFDRLYYYGDNRPVHVSAASDPTGQCVIVRRHQGSHRVLPARISINKFLEL